MCFTNRETEALGVWFDIPAGLIASVGVGEHD